MKTIELVPEDDIVSVLDRLSWSRDERILFVLPDGDSQVFSGFVDFVRLRREADYRRQQVGILSTQRPIQQWSEKAGIPIFNRVRDAESDERAWRDGRRSPFKAGLSPAEIAHHKEILVEERRVIKRKRQRPIWEYWVKRYLSIVAAVFLMTGLFISGIYLIPSGEIVLQPYTETIQTELTLTADTAVEPVQASVEQLPARITTVTTSWTTEIATTGSAPLPDSPGRGQVVFTNLTVEGLEIPAGTIVSAQTAAGSIDFQTIQPVLLPDVLGGTAAVDIVALELGELGNVAAETIIIIDEAFTGRVELRNPNPTSGGAVRPVPAVSAADQERLRAQMTQYLQTQAIAQIDSGLTNQEILARESLRVNQVVSEEWSHEVGEAADSLKLSLEVKIEGVVVDTNPAVDLVYNRLTQAVPLGYTLLPDSFTLTTGDEITVLEDGSVVFNMAGRGQIAADIDIEEELALITGQNIGEAMDYLESRLLLKNRPTATVFPNWLDRLPYLQRRIKIVINE